MRWKSISSYWTMKITLHRTTDKSVKAVHGDIRANQTNENVLESLVSLSQ